MLTKDQATRVLEAIHLVYPNYEAELSSREHSIEISPLVQSLYEKNKVDKSYLCYTSKETKRFLEDGMKLFEDQMEQERTGYGIIESVEKRNEEVVNKVVPKTFLEIQSQWKQSLAGGIKKEIELVKADDKGNTNLMIFGRTISKECH